ncbi:TRAP transporter large permease [Oceanibacterium hippocampi]|uniref:TRAP transporter large permease protein n=1 Tax=Oceanibacterium hippocampi TaxID=745714 RepID=A0A1Y5TWU3_9PROT|nr:TRAP transporter large permease [Oceanibacterium hippocampi]SLN75654.1 Sialic acid TRAP transporter permease protein SiaT [Oceanibacterium hippocampi]
MIGFAVSAMALLLALGVPVAVALGLLGIGLSEFFSTLPLVRAIGEVAWSSSTGFLMVSVPLFVLLGEILLRAGIADRMYSAVAAWLSWMPGGLMHANVGSSGLFAAMSGSSVATAATIGTTAMPQMEKYGYSPKLFLGTLAAGGTLGILIPPSINLIVYGLITNASIPQLYLAGIVPGLLLMLLFMTIVAIACTIWPSLGGRKVDVGWNERLALLGEFIPPTFIFVVVIGSIYLGWATATESAALGVGAATLLTVLKGRFTIAMFRSAVENTMRTTGMIMLIVVAAFFLNFVMTAQGLTTKVVNLVTTLELSSAGLMLAVIVFYLVLGCFMETMAMMIATIPIVAPVVFAAGFDSVWFGVVVVVLMEAAMITPPVGINLFVIQGMRARGGISDVAYGTLPFLLAIFALLGLLMAFPEIALFLPSLLR